MFEVARTFGRDVKTRAVVIHGNLNANRYQNEILTPVAIPHLQQNRRMVFMQDGATCHTAASTRRLLQRHNIRLLPWCAKSPDLNPIEHVWDELNRRIRRLPQPPRTLRQLEVALVNEWNNITQAEIRNYILSMRIRCLAVINANGGHTRY